MKIREATTAIAYLRVSTEEQARDAYGLESQERACRQLCEQRGWALGEIFRDAGVSGWADVERPEFRRMMKSIRGNRDVNLVFYDYSRFGRKTLPALTAFEELDNLGVLSVAATNPTIDCTIAAGRTARREELSKAEHFSDDHSEKTSGRMEAAFKDGRWCRPAPLGYHSVGTKAKGQPNIVPLEAEATLVVKSFELVQLGHDRPAEILRTMTGKGLRSKKGRELTPHVFLKMLRNPVYIGKMNSKKWGTIKGLHEPIVNEQVFRNVQLVLSGKKPVAAPYKRNREDFPLRRFLRCSECSKPLTGGPSKSATGKTYDYYRCYNCRAVKSLPASKAAGEFLELLDRLRVDSTFTTDFAAVLKHEWAKRTGDSATLVPRLLAQLKEQQELQEKLVGAYLRGDKAIMPVFERMNSKFEEDITALGNQIAGADLEKATFDQLLEFSKSMLVDIPTAWARASLDQKQRVQNVLFPDGLKYHPEKGILNSDNDCLFSQLESFLGGKMSMVRPERFELPTFWFEVTGYPLKSMTSNGLWPSRTGLGRLTNACWRSPGPRACCFSACAGSQTAQDRTATRVYRGCRVAFLLLGMQSAS
jgi:site-specific DNA recombinase